MAAVELREKIHRQVDLITEETDLEDLEKTLFIFLENRQVKQNYSPAFLIDLQNRSEEAQEGRWEGITTNELKEKMQQWTTK